MDRLTKAQRKKNMRAVKSKGSEIEKILVKTLRARGLKFKTNQRKVFGNPDVVFFKEKVVVFCDSEFWHGKDWKDKKKEIKSNKEFWLNKIETNIKRDRKVSKTLKRDGWKVLRFWGKVLRKSPDKCADKVKGILRKTR